MAIDNPYDIQYWIYASLNKKFGDSITIKRSFVSHMYDVNRHDFDVLPDEHVVTKQHVENFINSLFSGWHWDSTMCCFTKQMSSCTITVFLIDVRNGLAFSIFKHRFLQR